MIIEAAVDYLDHKKGKRDKKTLDVILRVAAFVAVGFIAAPTDGKTWWQGAILSLGLFVMFFDYIMGYLLTKNPFFLGKTSKTDSLWVRIGPIGGIIWRGVLFATALKFYYAWDQISDLFVNNL